MKTASNGAKRGRGVTAAFGAIAVALLLTASAAGLPTRGSAPSAVSATTAALAADPDHINFTLEGCRNDGSITLPIGGKFICPDAAYTTGNLGKGWNELDLVPHRLTTSAGTQGDATTDYSIYIAADHQTGGRTGYDFISVPVVNTAKSDASCTVTAGPQTTQGSAGSPFGGGTDVVIYRELTIHQNPGTTCVFDWFERLALGSHLYPGSSLQSYTFDQVGLSGGKKTISIPVNEILPQSLRKDMTATQGSDHAWDISKSPTPASLNFADTCDDSASRSKPVTITVTWTKLAAQPSGDITVITHVYAKNPSARTITTTVSDQIYSGTTALGAPATATQDVPANTEQLILTHTQTVPAGTTNLNDIATGTYTDQVTGIPIPGSTTATASAPVQLTGPVLNQTATITDVESITGAGLSFSADSTSGASGTFGGGYVTGTPTTGPLTWTSATQSGSGSVTFNKTVYAAKGTQGSGNLHDTATVTGSNGFNASASADVGVSSSAKATLTIAKTIPNVLQGSETATFTFAVKNSAGTTVATPTISFAAGETSKSVDVGNLPPGVYTVSEDPATGWAPQQDATVDLSGNTCSGRAEFTNALAPAAAQAIKITVPAGSESGWKMTLTGPGGPETVTTDAGGNAPFVLALQEGNYTITEEEQTGWTSDGGRDECSFTVNYPADAGRLYTCTFTNTAKPAHARVRKVTIPAGSESGWEFKLKDSGGTVLATKTTTGTGFVDFGVDLQSGSYTITETPQSGWISDGGSADCSFTVTLPDDRDKTFSCTFTNTAKPAHAQVRKVTVPAGSEAGWTFDLKNSSGTVIETKTTTGTGFVSFTTDLQSGSYTITERPQTGWLSDGGSADCRFTVTLPGDRDKTFSCTFTNTAVGHVKVVKTKDGGPLASGDSFTFELRQGAAGPSTAGTLLESRTVTAANNPVTFTTGLVPGQHYQLCEFVMPGWTTSLPNQFQLTIGGDNSRICTDFVVTPAQTVTFNVDNKPPPGGNARTIGFWKNWASCKTSGGNQKSILDQTLAKAEPTGIVVSATGGTYPAFGPVFYLVLHGSTTTPNTAPDCVKARNLLDKTTTDGRTKKGSDPAFNLAAQLVAAELNYVAGAAQKATVTNAINQAVLLLGKYQFNGLTHTAISAADAATMNNLAQLLDKYNNNLL
jgi:hypothetical protein